MTKNELCGMFSKQEEALIKALREVRYGKVEIYMDAGQPVRIVETSKSTKIL